MAPVSGRDAGTEPNYPIGSVDSALRLLLLFGERKTLRVSDASREIAVARSTAHRMMKMLEHYGFVSQDRDSKAYTVGPVLMNIGLQAVRHFDIRTVARPLLEGLVAEARETTNLWVLQNAEVLCVDSVESPRALRVGSRTGATMPAHASAGGRSLLAHLDPGRVREIYPQPRLPAITASTITSRRDLDAELERIRERGYAFQSGETESDVAAVASAVVSRQGEANFSLSIAVPVSRMAGRVDELGHAVHRAAAQLASLIAW